MFFSRKIECSNQRQISQDFIMKTELLILLPDNESFCNNKKAFIDLLKVDSLILVNGQKISYRRNAKGKEIVTARFSVETSKVKSNQERYFQLLVECSDEAFIDEFNELCERLKLVCGRISPGETTINTLWDDVGRIYAERSYPVINEVENLMRKLIAKFMLITVGVNWSKHALQPELLKKIESFEENEPFLHDLYKLDFIHLKQVLFEKKRDITLEELDRVLLKTVFNEDDKEKIRKYTPRSNWEKYFSEIVDEKEISLENKWARLYKLRNKVAHNRHIKKNEFGEINGIASAIKTIIEKATAKLGEIDIKAEDRDLIIQSYNSNSPSALGYISEKAVAEYYMKSGYDVIPLESNAMYKYDFIAEKDGQRFSVDIRSIKPRYFLGHIRLLERRELQIRPRDSGSDIMMKIHLVFVLREVQDSYPITMLFALAEKYSKKLGDRYEIIFGRLDEDNLFSPINWISNDFSLELDLE
ncbi:hypothetical protein KB206_00195 [Microvirga sp. STS02]|uniref:HEPN domain-containing protein n=1 Tax=Hymenobacter negativus TaxID=2795026 RepID=UPI0018DE6231|nr:MULTISPECIES: HEPN domain-containing protein [Bacteria]MBH8567285.1 hypothetical protein [Hymenobacter negativus]MBR7207017.1 hypothetical protein [Microvirga sp. STS02]